MTFIRMFALMLLPGLGWSCASQKTEAIETQNQADQNLEKPALAFGGAWADPANKEVRVKGVVSNLQGPVEFFACTPYGRLYESALALQVKPSHMHMAMLYVGFEPGVSPRDARAEPSSLGQACDVFVRYQARQRNGVISLEPGLKVDTSKAFLFKDGDRLRVERAAYTQRLDDGRFAIEFRRQNQAPELRDPEKPGVYLGDQLSYDYAKEGELVYQFSQPDPRVKGDFNAVGRLDQIQEEIADREVRAEHLLLAIEKQRPVPSCSWVFIGSQWAQIEDPETGKVHELYAADDEGLVMVMTDQWAGLGVLEITVPWAGKFDRIGTSFAVNSNQMPSEGTEIELVIRFSPESPW